MKFFLTKQIKPSFKFNINYTRVILYFLAVFFINFWHLVYQQVHSNLFQAYLILSHNSAPGLNLNVRSLLLFPFLSTLFILIFEKLYTYQLKKLGLVFNLFPVILFLIAIISSFCSIDLLRFDLELYVFILIALINLPLLVKRWRQSILYFAGVFLFCTAEYIHKNFGVVTLDQIFSTLLLGTDGVLSVSKDQIFIFTKSVVVIPLAVTGLIIKVQELAIGQRGFKSKLCMFLQHKMPILLFVISIIWIGKSIDTVTVFKYYLQHGEDLFAKNYVDPANFKFTGSHPKSLVFIYVESLETTYTNQTIFGRNLLQPLTDLKLPGISFNKYIQTSGANWTMGGVFTSQCGVPLKLISVFDKNDFGEKIKQFSPGTLCLSDVLKKLGYYNVFLKGGILPFSGTNAFLKTHHYDEAFGKNEWERQGYNASDFIGWGLPDDLLFQQAKLKLEQLIKNKKLFNLTVLTVDTHGIDGQLNQTCVARNAKNFTDIVECTAYEVSDFIHFIEQRGWLDKITVIVTGDHLAMVNQVSDKINQVSPRYIFNRIISQDKLRKNREAIFHVDLFPTVLNAIGIQWGSNQLALGYSAIAPLKPEYSAGERYQRIEQIFATKSARYNSLWLS